MTEPGARLRHPPYPPSSLVSRLEWLEPATKFPGTHTDMHWHAWGDDGALYCVDDDGENFGGPWNFAHFLRVTGTPPSHHVEEVSLFPELKRHSVDKYRYVDGALAVGSRLFVAAYDYIWTDPRRHLKGHYEEGEELKDDIDHCRHLLFHLCFRRLLVAYVHR